MLQSSSTKQKKKKKERRKISFKCTVHTYTVYKGLVKFQYKYDMFITQTGLQYIITLSKGGEMPASII